MKFILLIGFLNLCYGQFYVSFYDAETKEPISHFTYQINDTLYIAKNHRIKLTTPAHLYMSHIAYGDTTIYATKTKSIILHKQTYKSTLFEVVDNFLYQTRTALNLNSLDKHANTLVDVLEKQSGLNVHSYGGSGALQQLKIKGLSAHHSIVLFEGIRQNNFQNGGFNLSNSSTLNIGSVDLITNGASAKYGSDAMGGVINIKLAEHTENQITSSAGLMSYNGLFTTTNIHYALHSTQFHFGFHTDQSENYYPYLINHHGKIGYRNHADYTRYELQTSLVQSFNPQLKLKLIYKQNKNDAGTPGPKGNLDKPFVKGTLRQTDETQLLILKGQYLLSTKSILEAITSLNPQKLTYNKTSVYTNTQNTYKLNYQNEVFSGFNINPSIEYIFANLDGYTGSAPITATRHYTSLASTFSFIDTYGDPTYSFDVTIRKDKSDAEYLPTLYSATVKYKLIDQLYGTFQFGSHFRKPTFNELYWPNSGNPNIKSEEGITRSFGLNYILSNDFSFDANAFNNQYSRLIVWQRGLNGPEPVNKTNVHHFGLDTKLSATYQNITLSGSYLLNHFQTENNVQMVYVPIHSYSINLAIKLNKFDLATTYFWTDEYSIDTNTTLPRKNTVNIKTRYTVSLGYIDLGLFLNVNNFLNKYSSPQNPYPTPNLNIKSGITLKYKL